MTLPRQLRLRAARGAVVAGPRLCWELTDLVSGQPPSFAFTARIAPVARPGAGFALTGDLTGANFTATRAAATVQVPLRLVACTSHVGRLQARIAC